MMMIQLFVVKALFHATLTTAAYGLDIDQPGASCTDIYDNNPSIKDQSGYYLIKTDHLFLAHCDKEDNGWMRVADFDASRGDKCPTGWTDITVNNIRMCRSTSDAAGCYSTHFSVMEQVIVRYEVNRGDNNKVLQMVFMLVEASMEHMLMEYPTLLVTLANMCGLALLELPIMLELQMPAHVLLSLVEHLFHL